jgi:hypothetical protein
MARLKRRLCDPQLRIRWKAEKRLSNCGVGNTCSFESLINVISGGCDALYFHIESTDRDFHPSASQLWEDRVVTSFRFIHTADIHLDSPLIDHIVAREQTLGQELKDLQARLTEATERRGQARNVFEGIGGDSRAADAAAAKQHTTDAPEDSLTTIHPRLYHYTNTHAFRSIVMGNSLWSTYYEDLNDATEFRHMREPLAKAMAERFEPIIEGLANANPTAKEIIRKDGGTRHAAKRVARILVDALYRGTFRKAENEREQTTFVTSFCTHAEGSYEAGNGLLSQWRGYARDGGYCLVFDTARLEALIAEEQSAYLYWHMSLSSAHYFTGTESLPDCFWELVEQSKIAIEGALRREDFGMAQLFTSFVQSAARIKHRGFREESEARLIAMAATALTDQKLKGTEGYVSLPIKYIFTCEIDARKKRHISLFGAERSKLPVVKVIVGPARDQERNATIARKTVGPGVEVALSETPLVG